MKRTARPGLTYVTRTTDGMLPGVVYTCDGKTFAAEIADPDTDRRIRSGITTFLDIVMRRTVGITLAPTEIRR